MRAAGAAKAVERRLGSGHNHLVDGLAQLSLDSGLKIDLDVFTASRTGSLNLLKQLVSTGQPIDVTDDTRRTPLHLSSASGHSDCVEYLLELKADISARSKDNELTPLHEASTGETAELLLLARADVDASDAWGMTPLHLAAERGALEVVRCLLQYRADARRADGLGRTPLHLAAGRGRKAVVEELASHGADLDARDAAGRSALDHATAHGCAEAATALQEMAALLGAMGAGGTSLRALPAGSPARLTRGPNDKPAPRPRTGASPRGREASPGPPGLGRAGGDPTVQTLFLQD
jgi:ankyrin repeat protein